MITIDELAKLNLKIGEVIEVSKGNIKIHCNGKDYFAKIKLNVKKGDKIVISLKDDKLAIPLIENKPLCPDKDIMEGSIIR